MTTGLEVLAVTKALSPILTRLITGATDAAAFGMKKWHAIGFAKRLAGKLATADKIKTIWSPDKEISLLKIYFPSKIRSGNTAVGIDSLNELPVGNVVIEGIVGHGKSMFLRYLYLQELSGKGSGKLPLFIELRTLTDKRDLDVHLYDALKKMDITANDEIFDYLARSGELVILLDGFDEVDEKLVGATISRIEFLVEMYEDLKIVITSRPSAEIQKSRLFNTCKLNGLNPEDYPDFLFKLGVKAEKSLEIQEAIRKSPSDVSNLVKTPLMMTLLVMVYESENEIPSELPEFFDKLFTTMFTRHDRLKAGFNRKHHSGISERKLQKLFETFCFSTIRNKYGRSLSTEQFSEAFDRAAKYSSGTICSVEDFKKDIVNVSCLMVDDGYDLITFLHKSVAEYFAAVFIKHSTSEFSEKFYLEILTRYDTWSPVLTFLEKIDNYRYCKYYSLVAIEKLFEAMPSLRANETPIDDWIKIFLDMHPDFSATYSKELRSKPSDFIPTSWGGYDDTAPFGGELKYSYVNRIVEGLVQIVPISMRQEELVEKSLIFHEHKERSGMLTYRIGVRAICEEYGIEGFIPALEKFKLEIYRRFDAAIKVVEEEDSKDDLVDNMP